MKLNEQIREHRKKVGLTQEQVANSLGVSAPAVNKWENGSTYPDITLLAPLARLLEIDLNTLFTFHESLSKKEIGRFCNEVGEVANTMGFQAGFSAATAKLQEYPTCDLLRYSMALLLEGTLARASLSSEERAEYERRLMVWYEQAANSKDEETKEAAISILANKYLACGKTEKAQELIALLPDKRTVDKQMLKINVLMKQERYEEAAALAEMKIFSDIATIQSYFITLVDIDLLLDETDSAACVSEISQKMASLFGFWEYNGYVCPLQIALASKDAAKSIELIKKMLNAALTPIKSPAMFQHLPTKSADDTLGSRVAALMLRQLETDNECEFLRSDPDFQALMDEYRKRFPQKEGVS